jgi:integrase
LITNYPQREKLPPKAIFELRAFLDNPSRAINGGNIMSLTDTAIRNAKPAAKPVRLFDGSGLYLEISPSGGKLWRLKYRFDGIGKDGKPKRIEKLLSIGKYPAVSLLEARNRREEALEQLAKGIDPGEVKKAQKAAKQERAANSFEVIARMWHSVNAPGWSQGNAEKALNILEKDVFPWLGGKPVDGGIEPPDVLRVCRRIAERGAIDTAHRTKGYISRVMRFAIGEGLAKSDPCRDLTGQLPPLPKTKNRPAITDPIRVAGLLRAFDAFEGSHVVRAALFLSPLVFVRPGELRHAKWADFDFEAAEWRYTTGKTGTPHIVPLSKQAIAILKELHPLTGHGEHVFTKNGNPDSKDVMGEAAVNAALQRLGFKGEMTPQGFRAMATTILQERLRKPKSWIERQLAHDIDDPNGTAYDRTQWIDERREMMQEWADYLDKLKAGAVVIPLRGSAA